VPLTTDAGHALGGRDDIIYLGFAVIIVTLVGQGMTLPALVRRLRLSEHPSVADAERQARLQITQAVLDHLGEAADHDGLPEELADGLRAQYLARLHRLEAAGDEVDLEDEVAATAQAELILRRDLIAFQRRTLSAMHDQGRVGITTLRRIEHDLDLEEARLSPA
jgi:NhaP-type Na+/H+ or K+/H+ antiporter